MTGRNRLFPAPLERHQRFKRHGQSLATDSTRSIRRIHRDLAPYCVQLVLCPFGTIIRLTQGSSKSPISPSFTTFFDCTSPSRCTLSTLPSCPPNDPDLSTAYQISPCIKVTLYYEHSIAHVPVIRARSPTRLSRQESPSSLRVGLPELLGKPEPVFASDRSKCSP